MPPALPSAAAIASWAERTVPSASTHCTAADAASSVSPSSSRSVSCQAAISARGPIFSSRRTELVQKAQSPS